MLGPLIRSSFNGRFVHEFAGIKPHRDWLLKNVFLARSFCLVVGAPASGKSFLMLDLAMLMALACVDPTSPKEWFGRKFKTCGVIYIAGEGQEDFIVRIQAWFLSRGLPLDTRLPFYLIPKAIDLRTSDESAKKLIAEIADVSKVMEVEWGAKPSVIIVDTFNKALAGGDDTKPEHVGALIRNCDMIREHTGAAVWAVHHTAKNSKTHSPRGHGSVTGDNDGEIFVEGPDGEAPNTWMVERAKGAPRGDSHEFRLRSIAVGLDEERDEITSCYIAPGAKVHSAEDLRMRDAAEAARTGKPNMTADGRYILQTNALTCMRVLDRLVRAEKAKPDRAMPLPDVRVPYDHIGVSLEQWFDEIVRSMPGYVEPMADEANRAAVDKHRDKCRKARDAAAQKFEQKGLAGVDRGWIWRTTRRVAGVDRSEADEYAPKPSGQTAEQLGITADDIDNMF